jgi:hypothetical protein
VSAQKLAEGDASQPGEQAVYTVKTLFGEEQSLLEVFARSLAQSLRKTRQLCKPVLIAVSVNKKLLNDINTFRELEKIILELF